MREPAYRLYNCERCQVQVRICQRCDHGNVYCAGECARVRRYESQRRSQARYQRTVNKGLRRLIPDRVVLAGHMPDTIPRCRTAFRSNTQNRPASDRNAVRHVIGILSAMPPERCPSWSGTRNKCGYWGVHLNAVRQCCCNSDQAGKDT
jgi:hypothetical protein